MCSNATALAHPHRNMWPNMTSQVCGDTMYTNVIHNTPQDAKQDAIKRIYVTHQDAV